MANLNTYLRKDGRWEVRLYSTDATGKRRYKSVYGPTKEDTEKKALFLYNSILSNAVTAVKGNEKCRRDYMTMAMKLKEREEIGGLEKSVSAIRKGRGQATDDFLINFFGLNRDIFVEITDMLDENPDKSDWDIAETIING